MNTNENIKVVMNAAVNDRAMNNLVSKVARDMVDNGAAMPAEFEDIFEIKVTTRPSGSKYATVNFA